MTHMDFFFPPHTSFVSVIAWHLVENTTDTEVVIILIIICCQ